MNLWLRVRSRALLTRFSFKISLAPFSFPSTLASPLVHAAEKHPHSMMLPSPCFTIGLVLGRWWAVPGFFMKDMTLRIAAKQFNLGFIRPENFVSHSLRVLYACFLLWYALSAVRPDIYIGMCLSKSYPINWIYHRWTPNQGVETSQRWSR